MEQRYATNPAQIPGMTTDDLRAQLPRARALRARRDHRRLHPPRPHRARRRRSRRHDARRCPATPRSAATTSSSTARSASSTSAAPARSRPTARSTPWSRARACTSAAESGTSCSPTRDGPTRAPSSTCSPPPRTPRYPSALVSPGEGTVRELGDQLTSNRRTLNQYIHENGVRSCQIVMGVTELHPGSMWNTMPAHTHDRRTECYLYFDVPEDARVIHLLGERARDPAPRRRRPAGDHLAELVAALGCRHRRLLVHLGDGRGEPGVRRHGCGPCDPPAIKLAAPFLLP